MTDMTRTPVTVCWHCDRLLDAMSNMPGKKHKPTPGAISLCLYCCAVSVIGPDLSLYPPDEQTLKELENDRGFMNQFMQFAWYRQYGMVNERRGDEPDR